MTDAGRGRPRSQRARAAVLAAAQELLRSTGYERMSIEQIAARAGVGKQTIYRWWPSKAAVVAEAVLDGVIVLPASRIPDTGDLRADLERWFRETIEALASPEQQAIVRALAVAVASDPVAGEALYERITGPEQDAIVRRLAASKRLGEVRPGADLQGASDALAGHALFLVLARQTVSVDRAMGLLDIVLTGIRA